MKYMIITSIWVSTQGILDSVEDAVDSVDSVEDALGSVREVGEVLDLVEDTLDLVLEPLVAILRNQALMWDSEVVASFLSCLRLVITSAPWPFFSEVPVLYLSCLLEFTKNGIPSLLVLTCISSLLVDTWE